MRIKKLGIFGGGNVGASLVMQLAEHPVAHEVHVASRNIGHAEAAILDAGSACPETAAKFTHTAKLEGKFDIVVVTAGETPHGKITQDELLQKNLDIVTSALESVEAKIVVVIGTPVDRLTEKLSRLPQFKEQQVIGFGGQLDLDRTRYALVQHSVIVADGVGYAIGEHGPRTIPVYTGEEKYGVVRADVTTTLKRISAHGPARNLATGVQLRRLMQALAGEEKVLCVSVPDAEHDNLSVTWPYVINQTGIVRKVHVPNIGPSATKLLEDLLELRRQEAS